MRTDFERLFDDLSRFIYRTELSDREAGNVFVDMMNSLVAFDYSVIFAYRGAERPIDLYSTFDAGEYDVRLTPRTGVGVSNAGGQAEAGATLTVGQKREDMAREALADLGIRDGAAYGDQGRWYLFAAASGRAVGLNVLRSEGGWDRDGWTTDPSTALIGDAHVGVGYRKGPMQTSFGYIHREVKGEHMIFGERTREDSVVAFSLTIKPEQ